MREAKALLRIHTPDSAENIPQFRARYQSIEQVRENAQDVWCVAVFNGTESGDDNIEFTLVVSRARFDSVKRMFELLWSSQTGASGERITVNLKSHKKFRTRLNDPSNLSDAPFVSDFLSGTPMYFNGSDFCLSRDSFCEEPRDMLGSRLMSRRI